MSTKNLRKRTKANCNTSTETSRKNIETEEAICEDKYARTRHKQQIIASNDKIFYPCEYCYKIFPQKLTSIKHMKKCKPLAAPSIAKETVMNNNDKDTSLIGNDQNKRDNIGEHTSPSVDGTIHKLGNKDTSVYDYNEPDDDMEINENGEEALNNRQCKQCATLFDNPLDLLRHTRDCHNVPRKMVPPEEIEKYFDYPNRQYCPICEKPIKTRNFRSVFIKHLLVHTTGLTHECKVCRKKFRRRDHMRAHEKRHIIPI